MARQQSKVRQALESTEVEGVKLTWQGKDTIKMSKDGSTDGALLKFTKFEDGPQMLVSVRENQYKAYEAIAELREEIQTVLVFKHWIEIVGEKVRYSIYR